MTRATEATVLRLATRGSALARAQAALASRSLGELTGASTELVVVSTGGDRNQSTVISDLEGQGWFTAEIERALLDGRADVAVHSAKDLPTQLAPGLEVVALLPRADPRDAVVTRTGGGLAGLPLGARVGTSSARRAALIGDLRPDLECVAIRGNVDTRLRKLEAGEVDALVVATAGLDRLGIGDRADERLDPEVFVPAPAQGAIALEAVAGTHAARCAGSAGDAVTAVAVRCERDLLLAMGGGCLLPLGAWARVEGDRLVLSAALAVGGEVRRARAAGDPEDAAALVAQVAAALG